MYDYLVIGAGLFGSVFANEASLRGKSVLVIEKNEHIAGNCYTEKRDGINVHMYGPHIFHTDSEPIWNYVNQYVPFKQYKQSTKAIIDNKVYSLPISLTTLNQVWPHIVTPAQAKEHLAALKRIHYVPNPTNLQDWAVSQIGPELYELFIKGYTTKQWGRDPSLLPASIIKRLPIRTSFDDNYFNHAYQGIPVNGYTELVSALLADVDVVCEADFFQDRDYWSKKAKRIVCTAPIDEYFNYCHGPLEYRSLRFEHKKHAVEDYQGCSIINYPSVEIPYTRIVEHKHFEGSKSPVTWVTKEYPSDVGKPYYPIADVENMKVLRKYQELAKSTPRVLFGGRLAEYRYYDMDQVIASAITKAHKDME